MTDCTTGTVEDLDDGEEPGLRFYHYGWAWKRYCYATRYQVEHRAVPKARGAKGFRNRFQDIVDGLEEVPRPQE